MKHIIYFVAVFALTSITQAGRDSKTGRNKTVGGVGTTLKQSKVNFSALMDEKQELYLQELQDLLKKLDILNLERVDFLEAAEAKKATDQFDTAIRLIRRLVPNVPLERKSFEENIQLLHFIQKKMEHFSTQDMLSVDMLESLIDVYSHLPPEHVERFLESKIS